MKLIQNSGKISVIENALDDGTKEKTLEVVMANVGTTNDNGFELSGDVIEFNRDAYPLMLEHGHGLPIPVGLARNLHYDATENKYKANISIYDSQPEVKQSVENGAYTDVSIAYLVTEYSFGDKDQIIVNNATMKELSIVQIGADSEAKIFKNGLSDELNDEIQQHKANKEKLQEIKSKYE